ncbi:MAG: hypothetical protein OXE94_12035 [Aestuariivita sp.]|nr:hypothetical protein [Aestuariivita sp.]MCY4202347.1 hypothetical protein [Aestuariivita sp.]
MKSLILAMTKKTHETAFQQLFPGDGLEAAGVFICNQGSGAYCQRLVVTEFIKISHELCDRAADRVN